MFLDDELLEMCKASEIDTPEKVQQLNVDICRKCEDYYKSKLIEGIGYKQLTVILNKTFNLFDSFVRSAKKSTDNKLQILGKLFEEHTFKTQFLADERMNNYYKKGL